jgi:ribosomal protein L29
MKTKELREKTDTELDRMLQELREKLRELRFKRAAQQLADVREIRETRQAIARVLTTKRSRVLAAAAK